MEKEKKMEIYNTTLNSKMINLAHGLENKLIKMTKFYRNTYKNMKKLCTVIINNKPR